MIPAAVALVDRDVRLAGGLLHRGAGRRLGARHRDTTAIRRYTVGVELHGDAGESAVEARGEQRARRIVISVDQRVQQPIDRLDAFQFRNGIGPVHVLAAPVVGIDGRLDVHAIDEMAHERLHDVVRNRPATRRAPDEAGAFRRHRTRCPRRNRRARTLVGLKAIDIGAHGTRREIRQRIVEQHSRRFDVRSPVRVDRRGHRQRIVVAVDDRQMARRIEILFPLRRRPPRRQAR